MRTGSNFLGVMMVSVGLGAGCVIEASPPGGHGSSTGSGASGGSGGGGGGVPIPPAQPSCAELGGKTADQKFPGIDVERFEGGESVLGCANGFDLDAKRFRLAVSGAARISFAEGQLFANGDKCTAADGSDVVLDEATSIEITGGDGDDLLLLDLSTENASTLVSSAASGLAIDLRGGDDRVFVRGSAAPDTFVATEAKGALLFDVDADGEGEASIANAEMLVASLGDGDDSLDGSPTGASAATPHIVVCAGAGDDRVRGGASDDVLEGGDGNDTLLSASVSDGADALDGGSGVDLVDYSERIGALSISLDGAANDGEGAELDDVRANVEHVVAGAGDDTLVGSDGADTLDGGLGNDTIDGRAGDDSMNGGPGDDTFLGSPAVDGADVVNGGDGIDEIAYEARPAGVLVTLCTATSTSGCDDVCGCDGDDGEAGEGDNLVNVEGVVGTAFADVMVGGAGDDKLFGNGGDDVLTGNDGDDSLFGDLGGDQLDGGQGDDYLDGGEGADTFVGGGGEGDICVVGAEELAPQCELY